MPCPLLERGRRRDALWSWRWKGCTMHVNTRQNRIRNNCGRWRLEAGLEADNGLSLPEVEKCTSVNKQKITRNK